MFKVINQPNVPIGIEIWLRAEVALPPSPRAQAGSDYCPFRWCSKRSHACVWNVCTLAIGCLHQYFSACARTCQNLQMPKRFNMSRVLKLVLGVRSEAPRKSFGDPRPVGPMGPCEEETILPFCFIALCFNFKFITIQVFQRVNLEPFPELTKNWKTALFSFAFWSWAPLGIQIHIYYIYIYICMYT